jgi:hypothetical protein
MHKPQAGAPIQITWFRVLGLEFAEPQSTVISHVLWIAIIQEFRQVFNSRKSANLGRAGRKEATSGSTTCCNSLFRCMCWVAR